MKVPNWVIVAAAAAASDGLPLGWKLIGKGTQGTVYGKGKWVIKVFNERRDGEDAISLLKDIWTGRINKANLPRVGFVFGDVAVMERLDPITEEQYFKWYFAGHRGFDRAVQRLEDAGYCVNDINRDNIMSRKGRPVLNDVV